ncbi:MAG: KamA family radical SAM protein [Desulfobacterales bacterium]|nr:KamA family radical SAM protein [Desulfobacterales bacterium]
MKCNNPQAPTTAGSDRHPSRPTANSLYAVGSPDWRTQLQDSITSADALAAHLPVDRDAVAAVARVYPLRIPRSFLRLIRSPRDSFWRQAVPDPAELADSGASPDPSEEDRQSPLDHLVHRYPDRVVLLISNRCALYCRFCMRKRRVGRPVNIDWPQIRQAVAYIGACPGVREVILSGGDPLLRKDEQLAETLAALRRLPQIEIIRIHTRIPAVLPARVTAALVAMLKQFGPLYVNLHFNHAEEITPAAAAACSRLADAGIPLGSQSVLLKGVNNRVATMRALMRRLAAVRVRPYALHHPDPVAGTTHFRVPLAQGLQIMRSLRGHISGLCVPHYMADLPAGGGKVPLLPDYWRRQGGHVEVMNYEGRLFQYPDV